MTNKKINQSAVFEKIESAPVKVDQKVKADQKWEVKVCRVINYIPSYGILGFEFDGVGCQINVPKNLNISKTIKIQYKGEIGKNIIFKI